MSAFSAFSLYGSLDDDQKGIIERKSIDATHTVDEWITLLASLSTFDEAADGLRKVLGWTIALAFILGFVGAIVAQSWIVGVVALAIAIAAIVFYRRFKRLDLPNSLRKFLLPLLRLLREDMESTAPLTLKCDLRGGTIKEKAGTTENLPTHASVMSAKQTIYTDPWISGATTLADGSKLDWDIVDIIRQREVTKRTSRGKIKTKVKHKVRRQIDVKIGFPVDNYSMAVDKQVGTGNAADRMAIKQGEKRNVYKMRRVVEASDPNAVLDLRQFFDPIAQAYRQVALKPEAGGNEA